jgi:hypothetical protein
VLKALVLASALVATGASTAWAAGSTAVSGDVTRGADLDGDGRVDRVAVRQVDGVPDTQELVAVVRGVRFTARMPLHSPFGVGALRVTDLADDGRDEVVVTESTGANTDISTVWGLGEAGLRAVTTPDGKPLELAEGGGVSAVSRFGCEVVDGQRRLVVVRGEVVWTSDPLVYDGERVAYVVRDGIATPVSTTPVLAERNAPAYQVDPASCA